LPDAVAVDEDGDLVLDRRRRNKHGTSISDFYTMCLCDRRAAHLRFHGLQLEVTTIRSPFSMVLPARLRALAFRLENVDDAY